MLKTVTGLLLVLIVALALLHWVIPGEIEKSMNTTTSHAPYAIDPDSSRAHASLFIADLHADSMLWKRDILNHSTIGHVDLPRLQEGHVALQVFAAVTKSPSAQNYQSNSAESDNITSLAVAQLWPLRTWNSLFERAMYQLDKLKSYAGNSDDNLRLITTSADLRELIEDRKSGGRMVGGLFAIEGAHALEGDIDNLQLLYDEGLRIVGLTHFFDNELGGSLHGTSAAGLTEFGREVIRRADEMNMIIDVAHASTQMVSDVLALSRRPVILSHGGVMGICDEGRNIPDDLMKKIADQGGILGVGYWDGAVCDFSPDGIVDSIRYAIDLMGSEHVALGSDYDGTTNVLLDTAELVVLTATMRSRGFTEQEIGNVMGENVKRYLLDQLPP